MAVRAKRNVTLVDVSAASIVVSLLGRESFIGPGPRRCSLLEMCQGESLQWTMPGGQ